MAPILLLLGIGLGALAARSFRKKDAPPPSPAGTIPGGILPSCPPPGSPDGGVASLPVPWIGLVQGALSSPLSTKEALAALANQLRFCGQKRAANEVDAAAEKKPAGVPDASPFPLPEGAPFPTPPISDSAGGPGGDDIRRNGVATIPTFQWEWRMLTGQTPQTLAEKFFGSKDAMTPGAAPVPRWTEFIDYNTPTWKTTGVRGTSSYRFAAPILNQYLRVPKSWNMWIDQQGHTRGSMFPFPPVDLSGAGLPGF